MDLELREIKDCEIVHHASEGMRISSQYRTVTVQKSDARYSIKLPSDGWMGVFGRSRLFRRALRLDKCNVVPVQEGLVVIRQGKVFHYDQKKGKLSETLKLKNCRNVLHQAVLVRDGKDIIFGEYGNNPDRLDVPVYRSRDDGKTWQIVFTFSAGTIKHVHGCYWDPFEEKVWLFTGDFSGECRILVADPEFKDLEWIGDGQQQFRACNAFFTPETVHWVMDSQLETSHHMRLDRKTRQVKQLDGFPGPVWYIKELNDGWYLAATAQEIGPGVHDDYAHLLASRDLIHWQEVFKAPHDRWPKRYFKFGVIGFADGPQSSKNFYIFSEALKAMDGKSFLCQLKM